MTTVLARSETGEGNQELSVRVRCTARSHGCRRSTVHHLPYDPSWGSSCGPNESVVYGRRAGKLYG